MSWTTRWLARFVDVISPTARAGGAWTERDRKRTTDVIVQSFVFIYIFLSILYIVCVCVCSVEKRSWRWRHRPAKNDGPERKSWPRVRALWVKVGGHAFDGRADICCFFFPPPSSTQTVGECACIVVFCFQMKRKEKGRRTDITVTNNFDEAHNTAESSNPRIVQEKKRKNNWLGQQKLTQTAFEENV